ncbi:MAG: polysaccharide lyase, partial [Xylanibacter rarus]
MKKSLAIMAAVTGLCAQQAMAQYPQITPEAKAKFEAQRAEWEAHSDSAWQVAFPIVKKEAMEGRPYVPWAWRPYDLKQAKIPAFPGAEGGGMYTAGGRGGKVLVVPNLN